MASGGRVRLFFHRERARGCSRMQVKENTAKETKSEQLVRGFLFACTNKSEAECLKGLLFATE